MPEILEYTFMIRALLAGLIVAAMMPIIGGFLVAKRYSLIADSLAHVSLAGVGAGLLLEVSPIAAAVPITATGAIFLEWMRQRKQISGEASLAILMSGGLALAIVLAGLAKGVSVDFNSYLFGSIITTQWNDLLMLFITSVLVLTFVFFNYRGLLYTAFDEDGARIAGYKVSFLNYSLAVITAVAVVLSLRIVGGLLIGALLVIPIVAASQFSKSFLQTIGLGVIFSVISVLIGLTFAYYAGIAAGGAIVIAAIFILILSMLLKK